MESDYKGNEVTFAQIMAAASIALLFYDYFLTFTREVEWFWFAKNRLSWASLFFFANRYVSILGHIPFIYEFFSFRNDPERVSICAGLRSFRENLCFVTQTFVGCFLIARTYALWNRSKWILWFLGGISIPVVAYTIAILAMTHDQFHYVTASELHSYSCLVKWSDSRAYQLLTSWVCVLVCDVIVFLLCAYKVVQIASSKERPPILHLLLRDGTVYFGLVSLGCLVSVLTYWPGVIITDPYSRGAAEILANSLSSALASRLFLNLRDPTLQGPGARAYHGSTGTRFDFIHPNGHRHYTSDEVHSGQGHDRTMTVQLRTLDEVPEPDELMLDEEMKYGDSRYSQLENRSRP